jgi:hypothetical protein
VWHPRYWTLACVATFHLIFAATILTIAPEPTLPPTRNVVEIVTLPNNEARARQTSVPVQNEAPQAELKQSQPDPILPIPEIKLPAKPEVRPEEKRSPPAPKEPILATTEKPLVVLPPPTPKPLQQPEEQEQAPKPFPVPPTSLNQPASIAEPLPTPLPVEMPKLETVAIQATPFKPSLTQPDAQPLSIAASKLQLKQAPALKTLKPLELPTPPQLQAPPRQEKPATTASTLPVPTPQPVPVARPPSRLTPEFVAPKTAPLSISRPKALLPLVQVPRVAAADLRLPEVQSLPTATTAAASSGVAAGVTSVFGGLPSRTDQGTQPPATRAGSIVSGSAAANGQTGSDGRTQESSTSLNNQGGADGSTTAAGRSGVLPRRPGGASVRQPFPTSDGNTVVERMNKTFDCSRLNRDRDARCPNWDPIEGRNSAGAGAGAGAASLPVPAPKGLPTPHYPVGTNPLPTCPPGTPGNQRGLSCLPAREGPGIPKH